MHLKRGDTVIIREVEHDDLSRLLALYTYLHDNIMPTIDPSIENLWGNIINDRNHHIIVGSVDDTLVSSCVMMVVPNLTHSQRPYAVIENVITHPDYRVKDMQRKYCTMQKHWRKRKTVTKLCL